MEGLGIQGFMLFRKRGLPNLGLHGDLNFVALAFRTLGCWGLERVQERDKAYNKFRGFVYLRAVLQCGRGVQNFEGYCKGLDT